MAVRKAKKNKSNKIVKSQKRKTSAMDPSIEEIYEEEVVFNCPARGLVKQKVKVKRYKPLTIHTPHVIGVDEDPIEELGKDEDAAIENSEE